MVPLSLALGTLAFVGGIQPQTAIFVDRLHDKQSGDSCQCSADDHDAEPLSPALAILTFLGVTVQPTALSEGSLQALF